MTVILYVDALKKSYLDNGVLPNTFAVLNDHGFSGTVEQSWGFCERSEFLSGVQGIEPQSLAAISYNGFVPNKAIYFFLSITENVFCCLGKINVRIEKTLRYRVWKILQKIKKTDTKPYFIPFPQIFSVCLTEDKYDNDHYLQLNSQINKANFDFDFEFFTNLKMQTDVSDITKLNELKAKEHNKNVKLLVYLSTMDTLGHSNGSDFENIKLEALEFDIELSQYLKKLFFEREEVLIVGDHGMHQVVQDVNIIKLIRRNNLFKLWFKENVIFHFIDSTMLRLWCARDVEVDSMRKEALAFGVFEVIEEHWENGLKLIVCKCKEGIKLTPDFFNGNNTIKGMHGYNPKLFDALGFYWYNKKIECNNGAIKLGELLSKFL